MEEFTSAFAVIGGFMRIKSLNSRRIGKNSMKSSVQAPFLNSLDPFLKENFTLYYEVSNNKQKSNSH